jgi:IS30 family transposase
MAARRLHPHDSALRVSHETIYRDGYMPSRMVFDAKMFHHLRSDRPIRRPRRQQCSHGRGRIRNMTSIRARPAEADTREVAGHWEGDLVYGAHPSAWRPWWIGPTRYAMVVALPDGYKADAVASVLIEHVGRLPQQLRRTLTCDRGREMAEHARITAALGLPVFFCDPHHPWQLASLAARDQREHQPAAAPISEQERRCGSTRRRSWALSPAVGCRIGGGD